MYLCTEGKVTTGIGNALFSALSACDLDWRHTDGSLASQAEITAAFNAVASAPKGLAADHYASLTDIRISEAEIDSLFNERLNEFESELIHLFPTFNTFPEGPQLGLFDLIYQAGEGGLGHGFPSLCKAVRSVPPDWVTAGKESHRLKSSPKRNADTLALFQEIG